MPRIDWPDGAARIFVVTEITYTGDVRTGVWRTQLTGEQWTAGPETWGEGAPLSGGTAAVGFTAGPPEAQPRGRTAAVVGYPMVFDPNATADSDPPAPVTRIEWWWGDANGDQAPADQVVEDGPWAVGELPLGVHGYDAPGWYTVALRLTFGANPSGRVSQTVTVG